MNRLPHIAVFFAAVLLVAANKKPEKAKEPVPSDAQILLWIKQLGDESFHVREEATRNLFKAGGAAFDAVSKATESEDLEVKQRSLKIINHPENTAIAYFKKLGSKITVDDTIYGRPVIGLNLSDTRVSDAGLVHLNGLANLLVLDLDGTKVTDAGLVHLKGLANLQVLYLTDTKVTGPGLVHLKGLTNLQRLWLKDTKITDDGLIHLKGFANLRELFLQNTKITDAGLVHLKGLVNVRKVSLGQTKITDDGLVHLKGLARLRDLDLMGTSITGAGLVHLKGFISLQVLWLSRTKVNQARIERLKKALPKCYIIWDGKLLRPDAQTRPVR